MPPAPTHLELNAALEKVRLGVTASDLHGSLTGYLCAGGHVDAHDWLDRLELTPADAVVTAGDATLQHFLAAGLAQFETQPARIAPLLPATDSALVLRADALVEWCRGFLGGFGLVGSTLRAKLSDDASEILADFSTIATSRLDVDGGAGDEQAYDDVLEFVRTAAALLYREARESQRAAARSLH
jgi:uncharacterized protein YgfB (UPF0149 family)